MKMIKTIVGVLRVDNEPESNALENVDLIVSSISYSFRKF